MNEFKGTKGEWSLAKFKTKVFCRPKEKWMPLQPIAFIAEVPMDREERTANALLISKAPEMLEMLKIVYQQIDFSFEAFGSDAGLKMESGIQQLIKEATTL